MRKLKVHHLVAETISDSPDYVNELLNHYLIQATQL